MVLGIMMILSCWGMGVVLLKLRQSGELKNTFVFGFVEWLLCFVMPLITIAEICCEKI